MAKNKRYWIVEYMTNYSKYSQEDIKKIEEFIVEKTLNPSLPDLKL